MEKEILLQNLTWEQAKERIEACKGVVILPVGSTEQHGPHLPLGTDTYVATALAEAGAKEGGALVAPPLWYGWSPHHMVLPGTVTIRPEILIEMGYDVMASLFAHGLDKIILLNGHRIVNVTWLQIAAERAKRVLGLKAVIFDPAYMSKEFAAGNDWGEVGHAEEIEGSHMWHCYPNLVDMDKAVDNPHKHHPLYHVDPAYTGDTLCYVPSSPAEMGPAVTNGKGGAGVPGKSDKEMGKAYHRHLVNRLVQVIAMLKGE